MKLKFLTLLIIAVIIARFNIFASETDYFDVPVDITINGNYINLEDKPFLYNGTTFVPIRGISNIFGADSVNWNGENSSAIIIIDGKTITLPIGKPYAFVDDIKVSLQSETKLVNSRTYVPLRFITEHLDADIEWDNKYYTVIINKDGCTIPDENIKTRTYTDDHVYWLARIISCESQGEPLDGMVAVGNVVLNRVESSDFPNTIYGVIFDTVGGVQFEPVLNGTIYNEPVAQAFLAAKNCLEGENTAGKSLYFLNPDKATNFWIVENRTFYTAIGNHYFYL